MKALLLEKITDLSTDKKPLQLSDVPEPEAGEGEVLIRLGACGVCHTELDEIEGRTPPADLPVIPGHQAVGIVETVGANVNNVKSGDRVGVAWIYSSCGSCPYCMEGNENLCPEFRATGRDENGGYAEYMKADADFVYKIPEIYKDEEAAPLLCAGAIGYRSIRLTGIKNGMSLGLTGFGASAHLVLTMVRHEYPDTDVYVFARNPREREFALELGAVWSGGTEAESPEKLHAIIDTTPVWKPVVEALKNLRNEGRLVINAIRKEDADKEYLANLDYSRDLWMEKEIKSVANVSPRDVREFLDVAARIPIRPKVSLYGMDDANTALAELKEGNIEGAKVLKIS